MREKNYAIFGLGRFGLKVADTVSKTGASVLVADSDLEKVDQVADLYTSAVSFDMTNTTALEDVGLDNIDVLIIDLIGDLEGSIMCTMVAKQMGVDRIIATADSSRSGEVLKRLGADEVVIPEEESALRLAKTLISEDFMEYTDLGEGLCIVKVRAKDEWNNKSIRKLRLREKNGVNIIAVPDENGFCTEFSADRTIKGGEQLVLAMQKENLYQFI